MVSIASPEELLLGDAKKMLERELIVLSGKGNLEEAFAAWLLGDTGVPLNLSAAAAVVAEHIGGQRKYQDVAILGFAAMSNLVNEVGLSALREGLVWISGREPLIDGQPQGFCTDVIALLGIILGARAVGDDYIFLRLCEWFNKFIEQSFQSRLDEWQKCFLIAVCQLGNISNRRTVPDASNLAYVRVALRSKRALNYSVPSEEQDQVDALSLMKSSVGTGITGSRAALLLTAFNSIQRTIPAISVMRPSVEDVSRILRRIPGAFRRWTWESKPRTRGGEERKWHIDNEYHVQNLLYFLLLPIFPDLKDEDYTPSVGQKHPRPDLLMPSLSLIIEVKFMRTSDKPQDMIDQIAADSSLYLTSDSSYQHIVAFIWDDSCQSQEHEYMCDGLKRIRGIVDAVVVSRPGKLS